MSKKSKGTPGPEQPAPQGWRAYSQEIRFLLGFVALLALGFALISWQPINDNVIVPFTGSIAKVSGWTLDLIGQDITMKGTRIFAPDFAVDIKNGCNGIEALIIFLAAVLSFPAPWRARGLGLLLGFIGIQLVNLIRVVALFLTGVYFPAFFDSSHTVVWQTIVIAFAVLLWIFWAQRWALRPRPSTT